MNNKLIKKDNKSLFDKIKLFFKKLFSKNEKQTIKKECAEENSLNPKLEFKEYLKEEVSDKYEKEYRLKSFLKEIEENPDILEKLSNNRLDQLINYYEKITDSKREKIKKLKASLN